MTEEINNDQFLDGLSFEAWVQKNLENASDVKSEVKTKSLDTLREKNTLMVKELKSKSGKNLTNNKRWRSMIDDVADLRKKVDQTLLRNEFNFQSGLTSYSENEELQNELKKSN